MARAGIRHPMVGAAPRTKYPVTRANGTADLFPRIGGRMVGPAGGVGIPGRGSRPTGSGGPAAGRSITRSRIGEAPPGDGVIPKQQSNPPGA